MLVRKAVIPAAGYGTRFLPATKSQPKEMLPVVDTPTIQYVVQEAIDSGIKDILMIIGRGKRAIEEHFSRNFELEKQLRSQGKEAELRLVDTLPDDVDIFFVWQHEQLGLGDAIRYARNHVGNEPFAVLLGDTVLESSDGVPVIRQLMDLYGEKEELVVALEEVDAEQVERYGIVGGRDLGNRVYEVHTMIEKPHPDNAPSRLAVASRYVLPPEIFSALEATPPGKNGEIQLTDAIRILLDARPLYGYRIRGRRHDLGNKLDFLKTSVLFALQRDDLRPGLSGWLRDLVKDL